MNNISRACWRASLDVRLAAAIAAEPRIFVSRDLASVPEDARLAEDLGIDSVGRLYLVIALEKAFDVPVDVAEDAADLLRTWGDVLDWLEQCAAAADP